MSRVGAIVRYLPYAAAAAIETSASSESRQSMSRVGAVLRCLPYAAAVAISTIFGIGDLGIGIGIGSLRVWDWAWTAVGVLAVSWLCSTDQAHAPGRSDCGPAGRDQRRVATGGGDSRMPLSLGGDSAVFPRSPDSVGPLAVPAHRDYR